MRPCPHLKAELKGYAVLSLAASFLDLQTTTQQLILVNAGYHSHTVVSSKQVGTPHSVLACV